MGELWGSTRVPFTTCTRGRCMTKLMLFIADDKNGLYNMSNSCVCKKSIVCQDHDKTVTAPCVLMQLHTLSTQGGNFFVFINWVKC